jgi:exopolysaccharide production protein ExoY
MKTATLKALSSQHLSSLSQNGPAFRLRRVSQALKMVLDIVATLIAIILLLPLFIIVAVLIKIEGGPILFLHRRVGRNGKTFNCLKFRTMMVDSDTILARHLEANPDAAREWAERRKLVVDPRLTKIGRFLRQTSLDELPQLWNVVRGDMSVVGPRPVVTAELAAYGNQVDYYLMVRPGITGLWQVSGRSNTSYEERVALDVKYVQGWTMGLDLKIIAQTVPALISREGAV